MHNFNYVRADSVESATSALSNGDGVALIAGGTDLLPLMKDGIASPGTLVDISRLRNLSFIEEQTGQLRIGATASLTELAESELVTERYAALAQACSLAATPQLRNMSTIGGNLLQQPRCWYYRGEHQCWLKGGDRCYARNGENEQHAILLNSPDESRCVSVHPSDPAVALLVYDATVRMQTPNGATEALLRDLLAVPTPQRPHSIVLPPGAMITEVILPVVQGGRAVYLKAMPRASWAFALVAVALYLRAADGVVADARIGLGGVAPVPLRAGEVEALMVGRPAGELDRVALADALAQGATPLSQNGYKVPMLRGLFAQALSQVLG